MRSPNLDLLRDLAKLAKRYPARDWQAVTDLLRDDAVRDHLIVLLSGLAEISATTKRRPRDRRPGPTITRLLDEKSMTDPRAAELLREFRSRLMAGNLLRGTIDLRSFAERLGVKDIPSVKKREQLVNFIVRELASRSYENLLNALSSVDSGGRDFGDEYQRWVNVILPDNQRPT